MSIQHRGFDMARTLRNNELAQALWQKFLDDIKECYKNDRNVLWTDRGVEFKVPIGYWHVSMELPLKGYKFWRFATHWSLSNDADAGPIHAYINNVAAIATKYFALKRWSQKTSYGIDTMKINPIHFLHQDRIQ